MAVFLQRFGYFCRLFGDFRVGFVGCGERQPCCGHPVAQLECKLHTGQEPPLKASQEQLADAYWGSRMGPLGMLMGKASNSRLMAWEEGIRRQQKQRLSQHLPSHTFSCWYLWSVPYREAMEFYWLLLYNWPPYVATETTAFQSV